MAADVAAWTRDCQQCQRGKVTAQPAAAVEPIPAPARRFSHIHVDLVGPLPTATDGYSYLFTAVDRSTRWLEAIPLRDMSAASCADALIGGWVSRFGVPSLITSDRGTQFTSAVWEALCNKLGVTHTTTTAYHPQSNGLVERAHRQLKEALRSRLAGAAWPGHLPWALLGLRAAPKDDSNISSAELVYGGSSGSARRIPGRCGAARRRIPGTHASRSYFHPYETPPPPASADPGATPTGQLGVRAARRDDAAAHAAVCWPIRGTGVRGEDLPHPDREQGGQGVGG
jgi:hypothetical protein